MAAMNAQKRMIRLRHPVGTNHFQFRPHQPRAPGGVGAAGATGAGEGGGGGGGGSGESTIAGGTPFQIVVEMETAWELAKNAALPGAF